MKGFLIGIGVVIVLAILIIGGVLWTAGTGVVQKTVNAESIVGNYQWFYDQKGEIEATYHKFLIAQKNGMQEAAGIEMVLQSMMAEYNAKSKQKNRNLWKAKDLPYQITEGDLQ